MNNDDQEPFAAARGYANAAPEWEVVQTALDDLTSALDYGYIIGGGRRECTECKATAPTNGDVRHEEGCISIEVDALVHALRALREAQHSHTDEAELQKPAKPRV